MEKRTEYNIWYWVVAFLAVIPIQDFIAGARDVARISYSQFETYLDAGRIRSVAVGGDTISGVFEAPVDGRSRFVTTMVDPAILERIDNADVEITGVPQNTWLGTILSWVVPAFVFFALWMLFFRRRRARWLRGARRHVPCPRTGGDPAEQGHDHHRCPRFQSSMRA